MDQSKFVKTALRLPPELHAAVHEAARQSGRSYNAELLERLEQSFKATQDATLVPVLARLERDLARSELGLIGTRERGVLMAKAVVALAKDHPSGAKILDGDDQNWTVGQLAEFASSIAAQTPTTDAASKLAAERFLRADENSPLL